MERGFHGFSIDIHGWLFRGMNAEEWAKAKVAIAPAAATDPI